MTDDIPDTAVAQTLATLKAIRPVALTCIAAGAAVTVLALLSGTEDGLVLSFILSLIFAILSFAAMRAFLSEGQAEMLSPLQTLRDPVFAVFIQIEFLLTALIELIDRLTDDGGLLSLLGLLGYGTIAVGYARYGTVFPALVSGTDPSLAAARERHTTSALLWRLIAAIALQFFIVAGLILLPGIILQRGLAVDAPLGLALMTPVTFAVFAFTSVMIAVILSKAYQGRYSA